MTSKQLHLERIDEAYRRVGLTENQAPNVRGKRKRPLTIIIMFDCMLVLGNRLVFQFLHGKFLYMLNGWISY